MIRIKLYRHKEYKDIFLTYGVNGNCYLNGLIATKDLYKAIGGVGHPMFHKYYFENNQDAIVSLIEYKEIKEKDGFRGTAKKESLFRVGEFEVVELAEVGVR